MFRKTFGLRGRVVLGTLTPGRSLYIYRMAGFAIMEAAFAGQVDVDLD